MTNKKDDDVPVVEFRLIGLLKRIGPAAGSTIPQFMTNWLGSYMSLSAAVVASVMLPAVVPCGTYTSAHQIGPDSPSGPRGVRLTFAF